MVIFHCYVSSPEGISRRIANFQHYFGNDWSMMGCWFLWYSGQENWLEVNSGKFRKPSFTVQVVGGSYLPDLFPAQYDTGISPCLNSYLSSKRNLVVTTMTGLSCLMDGMPEPEIWPGTHTTKYYSHQNQNQEAIIIIIRNYSRATVVVCPWLWFCEAFCQSHHCIPAEALEMLSKSWQLKPQQHCSVQAHPCTPKITMGLSESRVPHSIH